MEPNLIITILAIALIIVGIVYKVVARNYYKMQTKEQLDHDN